MKSPLQKLALSWSILLTVISLPPAFSFLLGFGIQDSSTWVLSVILFSLTISIIIAKESPKYLATCLGLFAVLSFEYSFRIAMRLLAPPKMLSTLTKIGDMTETRNHSYSGHPFFHYLGKPGKRLSNNEGGFDGPFNKHGHIGKNFTKNKVKGKVRILAFGGSTTRSGYPYLLEKKLNFDKFQKYEVFNLGLDGYTSAHILSMFALKFQHWDADLIVLHTGWNERDLRNTNSAKQQLGYNAVFKSFSPVRPSDYFFIKSSFFYRSVRHWLGSNNYWASLEGAVLRPRSFENKNWEDLTELSPFRKNISTIIALAKLRNIKVILSTIPHKIEIENLDLEAQGVIKHIKQTNQILRDLAAKSKGKVFLLDLEKVFDQEMEAHYYDLGHLDKVGRQKKADSTANKILTILR
ncbi:MAG: SGNH/GDSL hydrolase family protein [Halobacteriovoraceae bacterium]|jgi:hypothetical protein|nr:SGNH/GDSL hydrolase family protein [Halobacteriovoraceae bacterium]MBT5094247.1 SGNH/GDSL hydrolase family protein [Halobacteriovoraceae bacterium]